MKKLWLMALLFGFGALLVSCGDDEAPEAENEEEIITDVTLTFTAAGETVVASAQDPDGEGPLDIVVEDAISLSPNTTYTLTLDLQNSVEGESITEEIEEEDAEHMFFFGFTDGIFSDPTGNGNVDNRGDAVNYNDQDPNGFPVGLSTTWTTGDSGTGTFRVILKHQPDIKSATSGSDDGESDIDLTWNISVQ
jgi:hypothetical protein